MNLESTFTEIKDLLRLHHEWLLIYLSGKTFALQKDEIELIFEHGKILFSFLDEKGFQMWRVIEFKQKKGEILLELSRNFNQEREKIRLIPRISAKELDASIELARLEKANKIANLLVSEIRNIKLVRIALNKENTVESIKNSFDSTSFGRVLSEIEFLYLPFRWLKMAWNTAGERRLLASARVLRAIPPRIPR